MKILNPLKMNDWPRLYFFSMIIILQSAVLAFTLFEIFFFNLPIITELLCFVYLTFVPGIILLRILRLHNLSSLETTLYSVALSLGTVMFIGLIMNVLYPLLLKISYPLSLFPIIVTITILVVVLSVLCYFLDKGAYKPSYINSTELFNPTFLFLCLIPFLTIIATYLMNYFNQNLLQMIVLLLLSFLPLISYKWMSEKYYPLAIFVASFSLLFHNTLISSFLWGQDINGEYMLANMVLKSGLWNYTIQSDVNAMLSINVLGPIYTVFVRTDLVETFKIIFPFLFSMVPLGVFYLSKKINNSKIALFAGYYFVSVNAFYTTLPAAARQEISELFMIILIILLMDNSMDKLKKTILMILFGFSIVVSHYGVSYIFILLIVLAFLISIIPQLKSLLQLDKTYSLNRNFFLLLIVFAIAWFMYVSSSSIFDLGVNIGINIFNSLNELTSANTQALSIMTGNIPILQSIERYLYIITQFFIGLGVISLFWEKYNMLKVNKEYSLFALGAFLLLITAVLLPNFANTLNTDRIFQISLVILAPFFVMGVLVFVKLINNNILARVNTKITRKTTFYIISCFFIVFILFNTAFIYQLFDQPKAGRFGLDNNVDFPRVNEMEISSITWLGDKQYPKILTYTDTNKNAFFRSIINNIVAPKLVQYSISIQTGQIFRHSYLLLGTYNIKNKVLFIYNGKNLVYYNISGYENKMGTIYDDGGSKILYGSQ